jgi:hypothetical protein
MISEFLENSKFCILHPGLDMSFYFVCGAIFSDVILVTYGMEPGGICHRKIKWREVKTGLVGGIEYESWKNIHNVSSFFSSLFWL